MNTDLNYRYGENEDRNVGWKEEDGFIRRHPAATNSAYIERLLKKPRFRIRLRDIHESTTLAAFIDNISKCLEEDAQFYGTTVVNSLQNLRAHKDLVYGMLSDLYQAAQQDAIPKDVRQSVLSFIPVGLDNVVERIDLIIDGIITTHSTHKTSLVDLNMWLRKPLKDLLMYAQNNAKKAKGESLVGFRKTIIRYLGPLAVKMYYYQLECEDFICTLIDNHTSLENFALNLIEDIEASKEVLRYNSRRIPSYEQKHLMFQLNRLINFLQNFLFMPERDMITALLRIQHLVETLIDI